MSFRLDFCSHKAASYAVDRWHYSRAMPHGKLVNVGLWIEGRFSGAIVFGDSPSAQFGNPYGLANTEVAELVRVALIAQKKRDAPTTQIVSRAIAVLRKHSPDLRLLVSFADSAQQHVGTIYQAGGWIFTGTTSASFMRLKGELVHPRTICDRYGVGRGTLEWLRENVDPHARRVKTPQKYRYVMPLDKRMRRRLRELDLAKPYPKANEVTPADTPGIQPGEGGSTPTRSLQTP